MNQNPVDWFKNGSKSIEKMKLSFNQNPISSSNFELDRYQCLKLLESELQLMMIRYSDPNRLNLNCPHLKWLCWLKKYKGLPTFLRTKSCLDHTITLICNYWLNQGQLKYFRRHRAPLLRHKRLGAIVAEYAKLFYFITFIAISEYGRKM